ncbi:bifunctional nuclease family protein, partial [bacterium]
TRVVINDLLDSTFYATIDVDTPVGTRHIDARPSDAIALAVRAKCPIFVDGGAENALVDAEAIQATPEPSPETTEIALEENVNDDEIDRFRRLLGEE